MPKYKKINKNNLLQNIVYLQVKKYNEYLLKEMKEKGILNEKEMVKFKDKFKISMNINIYSDMNKLEFE